MIELETTNLAGVQNWEVEGHGDDIGLMLATGYRPSNRERFAGYGDLLLMTLKRGGIRGFHFHKQGTDTAVVLAGVVRIVLCDMRDDSPTSGRLQDVILEAKPTAVTFLQIPPMVAHGFQGLADGSVLVDIPSTEDVATSDFFMAKPGTVPYEFRAVGEGE